MLIIFVVSLLILLVIIAYLTKCPCGCQSFLDSFKILLVNQFNSTGFFFSALIAVFSVLKLRISRDEVFERLFNAFNKRFDALNENLNKIRDNDNDEVLELIPHSDNNSNSSIEPKDVIKDYLNLCAEEYLWYRKCRIDPKVWVAWEDGMFFYLANENFCDQVKQQRIEKKSYYGLFEVLTEEKLEDYRNKNKDKFKKHSNRE